MLKFIKETAGTNQILVTLFLFLCCFFSVFLFVVLVFYKESLMFFFSLLKKIACVFFSCYTSKCAMHVIAFNALLRVFFSYLSLCLFSFDIPTRSGCVMDKDDANATTAAVVSAFACFVVVFHPICRNSFNYLDIYTN